MTDLEHFEYQAGCYETFECDYSCAGAKKAIKLEDLAEQIQKVTVLADAKRISAEMDKLEEFLQVHGECTCRE